MSFTKLGKGYSSKAQNALSTSTVAGDPGVLYWVSDLGYLAVDDGTTVSAAGQPRSIATASLPSPNSANPGKLFYLTDGIRGLWMDNGTSITPVSESINVKNFGAVGDGVTNDFAALQAAITAGAGKAVYLPPGTYISSATLVMPSNTTLYGVPGSSILKSTGNSATSAISFGSAKTNVVIRDLKITTTDDANATGYGVLINAACTDIVVVNCEMYNFYHTALRCNTQSTRIVWTRNLIYNIYRDASSNGINASYLDDSEVSFNRVHSIGNGGNGQHAMYASAAGNCLKVIGNSAYNCNSNGFTIYNGGSGTFQSPVVSNNTVRGGLVGYGYTMWDIKGMTFTNNSVYCSGVPTSGINIGNNVVDSVFANNTIDRSGNTGGAAAIVIDSNGTTKRNLRIQSNVLINNATVGNDTAIQVDASDSVSITDNTISGYMYGINSSVSTISNLHIEANRFFHTGTSAVHIAMAGTPSDITITNNVSSGGQFFMDLDSPVRANVRGNVAIGVSSSLGRLTTGTDCVFEDNIGTTVHTIGTAVYRRNNRTQAGVPLDADGVQPVVAITAFATGGQASATQLTGSCNIVSICATNADSVKLQIAQAGHRVIVVNTSANALAIFPATGGDIDTLGANNSYSLAAGLMREFIGVSGTNWISR